MQVKHSFNPKYAQKYGIEEAIIIENIKFWIDNKNAFSDEKIWYNGKLWLRLTGEYLYDNFNYITRSTMRRTLYRLIESNVLETDSFNDVEMCRGLWYAFTDKFNSIIQNE